VLILSSSPTVVREDLAIDLPDERDQLTTRSSPRFAELRAQVYSQIHRPKADAIEPVGAGPGSLPASVTHDNAGY
jgi:NitT/TauT family transport system ATP-binding protein